MAILRRLASGTLAAWAQITVNVLLQITVVPLYLSQWNMETYGVWQMIQATVTFATMFDIGHQTFLGNEFAKVGDSNRMLISKIFYSSLPIAVLLSSLVLMIVGGIILLGMEDWLFGLDIARDHNLLQQAALALFIQSTVWVVFGSTSGIIVRALMPFGYYPHLTWLGTFHSIMTSLSPAVAVMFGSDLLLASLVQGLATTLFYVPVLVHLWRIIKCEGIVLMQLDWTTGLRNLGRSLLVTASLFLDMARLQGVRLLLSPMVGVAEMAAFSTMRTGANVALQGLGTITNPLMPELMRFLRVKDQDRTEASFGFVWLLIVSAMCPAVILIQWIAPPLFDAWTRGKIHFDPILFALLSMSVLIYALAQPAVAVVQGNNLIGSQLTFSGLTGGAVIIGVLLLVPSIGIRGAAIAIIAAESICLLGYSFVASSWLKSNLMRWPIRQFAIVAVSILLAGIGLARIALDPHEGGTTIVIMAAVNVGLLALYWSQLPQMLRSRASSLFLQILPGRRRQTDEHQICHTSNGMEPRPAPLRHP